MPSVSNGNLTVLKWQNIHVISNIKYAAINIVKPGQTVYFTFSRGVFLRFPPSKQGVYLIGGN